MKRAAIKKITQRLAYRRAIALKRGKGAEAARLNRKLKVVEGLAG